MGARRPLVLLGCVISALAVMPACSPAAPVTIGQPQSAKPGTALPGGGTVGVRLGLP